MTKVLRALYAFRGVIEQFAEQTVGINIESSDVIVIQGTKVMDFQEDEFQITEGPGEDEAIIEISNIDGGSFD